MSSIDQRVEVDASLKALAHSIRTGSNILFITGAGLSVASGIAPYRGTKNAIWSKFVVDWGTKMRFKKNPSLWWNQYWLRTHETLQFINAKPNSGHIAIAQLSKLGHVKVITQNIDRLHHKTCLNHDCIVEIHGRLGYYRCVNHECPFSNAGYVDHINYDKLAINGTSLETNDLIIQPPLCPNCGDFLMPLSLLFDETYNSHSYYDWDSAAKWMVDCDSMVFVGTSFSVGITQTALEIAGAYGKPVYSFNLYEENLAVPFEMPSFHHVIGKAEFTLPTLFRYVLKAHSVLYSVPQWLRDVSVTFLSSTHNYRLLRDIEKEEEAEVGSTGTVTLGSMRRRTVDEQLSGAENKTVGPLGRQRECVCGNCVHVPLHLPSLLPSTISSTQLVAMKTQQNDEIHHPQPIIPITHHDIPTLLALPSMEKRGNTKQQHNQPKQNTPLSIAQARNELSWDQIKDMPVDLDDPDEVDALYERLIPSITQPDGSCPSFITQLPLSHPSASLNMTFSPPDTSEKFGVCDICGTLEKFSEHTVDGIHAYSTIRRPRLYLPQTRFVGNEGYINTKVFPLLHPTPFFHTHTATSGYQHCYSITPKLPLTMIPDPEKKKKKSKGDEKKIGEKRGKPG